MAGDSAPISARLLVPSLVVAGAAGCVAAFSEPARWVAFAVFLVAVAASLWAAGAVLRAQVFQTIRLRRVERRVRSAREESAVRRRTFDDLIEGLRVMLFVVDSKFEVLAANRAARKAFDFPDPVGHSLIAVTHTHELEELAGLAANSETRLRDEVTIAHPSDARVRVYAWRNTAVPGQVFLSLLDVTELRRLETVRRDFVANVSHELRTPMTTIRAMSETLLDGDPADKDLTHRYLEKIIREVDRLTAMTDDLLTLSKAENEKPLQRPFNFAEVVRSTAAQLEAKARGKGIEFRCVTPEDVPVMGSGSEMTQVVLNLVDNAINYTQQGSVEVLLTVSGDATKLTVTDTGIGVAQEHQGRIFERFYRVDKGRSRATGGTGLGLSIVRHIVQTHEGTIEVESELNKGSTFTVVLPVSRGV